MKPITIIVLSGLLAFIVAYSTVQYLLGERGIRAESKVESAYDRVIRNGTIRCGYATSPPQLMKDPNTGVITGVDHDIWEEVAAQLDLKIEWTEEVGWGNFIEGLHSNRYDAFCSGLWPDYSRSKFLSLSIPTIYSFVQTYVRSDDHRFDKGLDAVNSLDVTIPAVEGDVTMMMAKTGFPKAKVLAMSQTSGVSDMFMSLVTKKADILFLEPSMFASFDKDNKGAIRQLENVPPSFVFATYYGFNSGDYQLRDIVNTALRGLLDSGKIEEIAHRYSPDYVIAKKNFEEK